MKSSKKENGMTTQTHKEVKKYIRSLNKFTSTLNRLCTRQILIVASKLSITQ